MCFRHQTSWGGEEEVDLLHANSFIKLHKSGESVRISNPSVHVSYPCTCSCLGSVGSRSASQVASDARWIIERRPLWSSDVDESRGEKKGGGEVISGEGKGRGLMVPVQERSAAALMWSLCDRRPGDERQAGEEQGIMFFFFFTPALKLYCRKSHLVEASPLFLMASNTLKFVTMRAESFSESSRTLSDRSDRQPAVSIKAVSQWTTEGRAKNTSSSWADACWLISRQNLGALYT